MATGSIISNSTNFFVLTKENLLAIDVINEEIKVTSISSTSNLKNSETLLIHNVKINEPTPPTGSSQVKISRNGKFVAVSTEKKELFVWNLENWETLMKKNLVKRPMVLEFSIDSETVLVADKAGDVYSFQLNSDSKQEETKYIKDDEDGYTPDVEPGPEPILGHLSMLLGMEISNDGRYIVTCDRDEKLRVSEFPHCYNIHTYCLGHEEFVSCLNFVPEVNNKLLSSSGDGTIRLWNFHEGSCLQVLDIQPDLQKFTQIHSISIEEVSRNYKDGSDRKAVAVTLIRTFTSTNKETIVVAAFNKLPVLLFYKLNCDSLEYLCGCKLSAMTVDLTVLDSTEIVVLKNVNEISSSENPFTVLKLHSNCVNEVSSHPILKLGKIHSETLKEESFTPLDVDSLYKQKKYDNVSNYLQRKRERIQSKLPPKKGRYH